MVRGVDLAVILATTAGPGQGPPGILQTDPVDPTGTEPRGRISPIEEREPEAR
jgi:hypothetical protein